MPTPRELGIGSQPGALDPKQPGDRQLDLLGSSKRRVTPDKVKWLSCSMVRTDNCGLLVVMGLINSYRPTGAMWFVPGDLVLFAVFELGEPVEDDTYRRLWGFSCVVADRFGQNELFPIQ